MELHRFFKQPVFLFIVFVFIGGQIFDLKVFAQTQEDSLVIITRFETSIKKINKESSTRDELFYNIQYYQENLKLNSLPPELQSLTFFLFENLYKVVGDSLEYRLDEVNWSIISCLIGQRNFLKDSVKIEKTNKEITALFEKGLPVLYEKYTLNNDKFKSRFTFYLEQFSLHDPDNPVLDRIRGHAKQKRVNIILIVFSIIILLLYFKVIAKDSVIRYELGQKPLELSEISMVFTLALLLFFSLFIEAQHIVFVDNLSAVILFLGIGSILYAYVSKGIHSLEVSRFFAVAVILLISGGFFYMNRTLELLFAVIGTGAIYFLYRYLSVKNFESAVLVFFTLPVIYLYKNNDIYNEWLGQGLSPMIRYSVMGISALTFSLIMILTTYRLVRIFAGFFLFCIPFSAIVLGMDLTPEYLLVVVTGIASLVGFWLLTAKTRKLTPLTIKFFNLPSLYYLDDKKKMAEYAGKILRITAEYTDQLSLSEMFIIKAYHDGQKISDPKIYDKLYSIVKDLDIFFRGKPERFISFWITFLSELAKIKEKIQLLNWLLKNNRTEEAETLVGSFKDKDSILKIVPQIKQLYQLQENTFRTLDPDSNMVEAYQLFYTKNAMLNWVLVHYYSTKRDTRHPELYSDYLNLFYDNYPISDPEQLFFIGSTIANYRMSQHNFEAGYGNFLKMSDALTPEFFAPQLEMFLYQGFCQYKNEYLSEKLFILFQKQNNTFYSIDIENSLVPLFSTTPDPWLAVLITIYCHINSKPCKVVYNTYHNLSKSYKVNDDVLNNAVDYYLASGISIVKSGIINLVYDPSYEEKIIRVYFANAISFLNKKDYQRVYGMYENIRNAIRYIEKTELISFLDRLSQGLYQKGDCQKTILCMKEILSIDNSATFQFRLAKILIIDDQYKEAEKLLDVLEVNPSPQVPGVALDEIRFKLNLLLQKISPADHQSEIDKMLGFNYFEIVRSAINHDYKFAQAELISVQPKFDNFRHFTESFICYAEKDFKESLMQIKSVKLRCSHVLENLAILYEMNDEFSNAIPLRKSLVNQIEDNTSRFWYLIWLTISEYNIDSNCDNIKKLYYD